MMLPLAQLKVIPVFYSAQYVVGDQYVLIKSTLTPALEADFDIEIIEKHHDQSSMHQVVQLCCWRIY